MVHGIPVFFPSFPPPLLSFFSCFFPPLTDLGYVWVVDAKSGRRGDSRSLVKSRRKCSAPLPFFSFFSSFPPFLSFFLPFPPFSSSLGRNAERDKVESARRRRRRLGNKPLGIQEMWKNFSFFSFFLSPPLPVPSLTLSLPPEFRRRTASGRRKTVRLKPRNSTCRSYLGMNAIRPFHI